MLRQKNASSIIGNDGPSLQTNSRNLQGDGDANMNGMKLEVTNLFVHPIKSCKVIEVDKINVSAQGLQYDREFSFAVYTEITDRITEKKHMGWQFVTQRGIPALATVNAEVVPSAPGSNPHDNRRKESLEISWPSPTSYTWLPRAFSGKASRRRVRVPINPTEEEIKSNGYKYERLKVWMDTIDALMIASTEEGDQKSTWIEELVRYLETESLQQNDTFLMRKDMKKPFALFRLRRDKAREVFRNAPTKEEAGYQPIVGFQDSYPLSIQNLASVHDVADRIDGVFPTLNVRNFRPNIVFSGAKAYEEDFWKRIRVGGSEYYVTNRTSRCKLPNVDQETGKKHPEQPEQVLKSFRKIDPGCKNHACLGMMMVPVSPEPTEIKVGDEVEVVETGEHLYVMQ